MRGRARRHHVPMCAVSGIITWASWVCVFVRAVAVAFRGRGSVAHPSRDRFADLVRISRVETIHIRFFGGVPRADCVSRAAAGGGCVPSP